MAGQYGEIDSRADYHRVLGEAANSVTRMLAHTPGDAPLQRINNNSRP